MKAADLAKSAMIANRVNGENAFAQLLQRNPNDGMVYFKRGEAYEALGENTLAAGDFERAKEFFPRADWRNRASEALNRVQQHIVKILVFISHSSKDKELALALIELLRNALGLRDDEIRCTSVDGFRLPAGAKAEDQLKTEVHAAQAFIGLITSNSLKSAYVLFELGARWATNRQMIPLLAGIPTDALEGPLREFNAIAASNAAQLHQLVTDIGKFLHRQVQGPASYTRYIEALAQKAKSTPADPKEVEEPVVPAGVKQEYDLRELRQEILKLKKKGVTISLMSLGGVVISPNKVVVNLCLSSPTQVETRYVEARLEGNGRELIKITSRDKFQAWDSNPVAVTLKYSTVDTKERQYLERLCQTPHPHIVIRGFIDLYGPDIGEMPGVSFNCPGLADASL